MTKVKKQRAERYEKPLAIEGTFDDVIRVAMGKKKESEKKLPEPKKTSKKKAAKKK